MPLFIKAAFHFLLALIFSMGCSLKEKGAGDDKLAIDSAKGPSSNQESEPAAKAEPEEPRPWPPKNPIIRLNAFINPTLPQHEVYFGDWRFFIFNVDDYGRKSTGSTEAIGNLAGYAEFEVPAALQNAPIVVRAYNNVAPFTCDDEPTDTDIGNCRTFDIFIPQYCYDQGVWVVGPLEDAVWTYYRNATLRHGMGLSTHQVDCENWIQNLQALYLTDIISDELTNVTEFRPFHQEALIRTYQENQPLLVSTHPPICMAERRHDGGSMDSGDFVHLPFTLGEGVTPCLNPENAVGTDPIEIGMNGTVKNICGLPLTGELSVNGASFFPDHSNILEDRDFMGVVSHQRNTVPDLLVSVFNTQLGNGRPLDDAIYKNACALTSVIQFENMSPRAQDLLDDGTGVIFRDLFGSGIPATVFQTSDGDNIVDNNDYWAIFSTGDVACEEQVLVVEFLGHRRGNFRDNLHMTFDLVSEDLFLGLRADYELNSDLENGSEAFLSYTLHFWDGSTLEGRRALRQQFATCYLATDPWALSFFKFNPSEYTHELTNPSCNIFCPLQLAEYAARSQCFSNSRANQRWQNYTAGIWSMNSIKNVASNLMVNAGWLAPFLNVEIYVQKFNEAAFKGPMTIRRTDEVGQLSVELPTLTEGDRVLIKAEDDCCEDFQLAIPCLPAYTSYPGLTLPLRPPL